MPEPSAAIDRPILVRDAIQHKQEGESVQSAYFRLRDERVEFKSEGACGRCCSCQVKCHA